MKKTMMRIVSLVLALIMAASVNYGNVEAASHPDPSKIEIISETTEETQTQKVETTIFRNEFGSLSTIIKEVYTNGLVHVRLFEEGEVYSFTNFAHTKTRTQQNAQTKSEIDIQPITDKFSTKIITKTAGYIAAAVAGHFVGITTSMLLAIATDWLVEIIDENITHTYYTATVNQKLVSDGAVSYYKVSIKLESYKNKARTNKSIHGGTSYYHYQSGYPY